MKLASWLEQGPFSLSLSAGYFGIYAHCGFTKALWELGARPEKIRGTSAGSLLGSLICAGYSPIEIEKIITKFRRHHFWDIKPGLGLLEGKKFRQLLSDYLPPRFEDLKIPMTIATYEVLGMKGHFHSQGDLISTIHASCCFPVLFQPVLLKRKLHMDGGFVDWLAVRKAAARERVLVHFIKPSGFHSPYIHWQAKKHTKPHHHVISLPKLIEISPLKMEQGQDAIDEAYEKFKRFHICSA